MYGGCALSTELNEVPPKAAVDSRGSCGIADALVWGAGAAAARWCRELRGLPVPWLTVRGATGAAGASRPTGVAGGAGRWGTHWPDALLGWARLAPSRLWQDLRAVYDSRVSDGKRDPLRQDTRAVCSPTALCRAFRTHGAHILPKPAHFGCMAANCCREPAFFPPEAPSGTHGAKKMPRIAARGTRHGEILPSASARDCIAAQSCYGRSAVSGWSAVSDWPAAPG